ncbi:MAG: beta-propeller domain-containing protein [Clostridia bacterium]|nr:beta-propeller domain-containing protein [Clostridia bacterium]
MKKEKREKLLLSMNLIDEAYIEEADRKQAVAPFNWRKFAALAACVAVVLVGVGAFWLMRPNTDPAPIPPQLKPYQDSEYFPLIQKLDAYYQALGYSNGDGTVTFPVTMAPTLGMPEVDGSTGSPSPGAPGASDGGESYQEITDNQVEGVIEADIIKRSDKYIYHLNGVTLKVYSIEGENSKKVGSYTFKQYEANRYLTEMYLSEDCKTVTLIVPGYSKEQGANFTQIVSLDVSNPEKIIQKNCVTLNYRLNTSRKVDGSILLLGTYSFYEKPDYSDPSTFVPQITMTDSTVSVPMSCIMVPDELKTTQYTVVCKLDENTLELKGSGAFLSYTNGVYVSQENVFATHSYTDSVTKSNITTTTTMTEIAAISYSGDSLKPIGSVSVAGTVKDQYSMDEHKGILRVTTTTRVSTSETYTIDGEEMVKFTPAKTSASLYCVDLSTWKVVAKVENFAPEGETVRSARFEGDIAYVCTAVSFTDPVFFFDLSDLSNITYTDTGTIEGFSTSLISFGDGYLVGIGYADSNTVKLEVYQETEDSVKSVCSYQIEEAYCSEIYKSYLIDRKNQLIGLGIEEKVGDEKRAPWHTFYYLFSYQDGSLIPVQKIELSDDYSDLGKIRSVYIDGYLYVFLEDQFRVVPVDLTTPITP